MSIEAEQVALRRAEKVALFESRKSERAVAREGRKTALCAAAAEVGAEEAGAVDAFWSHFTAAEKSASLPRCYLSGCDR